MVKVDSRGFTLLEALVTIAVISLLVALLAPAVLMAREASRRIRCLNHMKQIGLAFHSYHDQVRTFPPGYVLGASYARNEVQPPGWGWGASILSSLEQSNLFHSINFSLPLVDAKFNQTAASTRLECFTCPSSPDYGSFSPGFMGSRIGGLEDCGLSQYVASSGRLFTNAKATGEGQLISTDAGDGVFYSDSRVRAQDITDGVSGTFLLGEKSRAVADATWVGVPQPHLHLCTRVPSPEGVCVPSVFLVLARTGPLPDTSYGERPDTIVLGGLGGGPDGFSSSHPNGSNFLMADGSVRFLKDSISGNVLRALATRAANEVLNPDDF